MIFEEITSMTERDCNASYWEGFYAGTETPDTLYEKQIEIELDNPPASVFCFSKRQEPKTWYLGVYEGNTIRPVEEASRKEALEYTDLLIHYYKLSVKSVIPIETPLITALSKDEFTQLCKENAAVDNDPDEQIDDIEDPEVEDRNFSIFDARSNFKRWQFAVLIIGLSSFLALIFDRHIIWSSFYLLNGTYLRSQSSALLFFAWGIPLMLFNALFTYQQRNFFTLIVLSFAPVAIRQISLLRNYSIVAMIICDVIAIAVSCLAFFIQKRRREEHPVLSSVETVRNAGAMTVYLLLFICVLVDLFIPSVSTREIQPVTQKSEQESAIRYVAEEDLTILNSEAWTKLPATEQSRILLSIAEEMSDEMGIATPSLYLETETNDNFAGYYSATDNSIHIWKPYLEHNSAEEATNVILHEMFHAFQQSVLDSSAINWDSPDIQTNAYFATIRQWKQENEAYISSDRWDVQNDAYYDQLLEEDARSFSKTYISRFIKTNEPDEAD